MPSANITLFAQWYNDSGTEYQVIYNGNGSTSGTAPATVNYNQYQGVPNSGNTGSLTNGSLTFYGWNTAANGTGTPYPVGSNGFTMPASNVTLYAQWVDDSINYTLTYDGNGSTGGSVPAASTSYPDGAGVSVLGRATLVQSGYTFLGWNTQADGTGTSYPVGNTILMNADNTLYAQWVGGSSSKNCGSFTSSTAPTAEIGTSGSRVSYRDNTNNTITIISPTFFSNGPGPYGTGNGPIDTTHTGNLLSTNATAVLSQVAGVYQIDTTYTTKWTGQTEIQTSTLILGSTYWPTGETISDITIPLNAGQPATFTFDSTVTPNYVVSAGGCFNQTSNASGTITFASIIAFYINFSNGTTTRLAFGNEFRWTGSGSGPFTYVFNYARVELANGPTPSPIPPLPSPYTGVFTPTNTTAINTV